MKNRIILLGVFIVIGIIIVGFNSFFKKGYTPIFSTSSTLNFPVTAAGASSDLTITLNGAVNTDVVILGVDNAAVTPNSCYTAWVSGPNTVTVRFNNIELLGSRDPASGIFKITIIKN